MDQQHSTNRPAASTPSRHLKPTLQPRRAPSIRSLATATSSLTPSLSSASVNAFSSSPSTSTLHTASATLIHPAYSASTANPQLLTRRADASDAAARLRRVASNASLVGTYRPKELVPASAAKPSSMAESDVEDEEDEDEGKKTGEQGAALATPRDPDVEAEASSSLQPDARIDRAVSPKRPLAQASRESEARGAARRRTWWGLGAAAPVSDGPSIEASKAEPDLPPEPMNEDERRFREELLGELSLAGSPAPMNRTRSGSSSAGGSNVMVTGEVKMASLAPPSPLLDDATPLPSRTPSAAVRRAARRASWMGWRSADQDSAAPPLAAASPAAATRELSEEGRFPDPAPEAQVEEAAEPMDVDEPETQVVTQTRTITKRSWLGYKVEVAVSEEETIKARPVAKSQQPALKDVWAEERASDEQAAARPPDGPAMASQAAAPSAPAAAASSSWLWPTWRSAGGNAPPQPPSQPVSEPAPEPVKAAPPQQPIAITPPAPAGNDTAAGSQGSYFARWIPYWGAAESPTSEPTPKPPSPAEQVKAAALARDAIRSAASAVSSAAASVPQAPAVDASAAVLNASTRNTWTAYFGSRSARPAARIQDAEAEVMAIDFGEMEGGSAAVAKKAAAAQPPAPTQRKQNGGTAPPPADDPKPDPAPPQPRPALPLTGIIRGGKGKGKGDGLPPAGDGNGNGSGPASRASSVRGPAPNLVLPTFQDTFERGPRAQLPPVGVLTRTLSAVNAYLFSKPADTSRLRKSSLGAARRASELMGQASAASRYAQAEEAELRLPRTWKAMRDERTAASCGCAGTRRVVVLGIHGWFSTGPLRNVFGEPTGTSTKFAGMMSDAVKRHFERAGVPLRDGQLTMIPLEGDGRVADRVERFLTALVSNKEWLAAISQADVVFAAAHSQGSIVATHLLSRLIQQRHIDSRRTRIALLAMCGIHHGPFTHLRTNIASYYLSAFESPAAKELFEFQSSSTPCSVQYAAALQVIANAGVKIVYVASVDDQVVPLYSALNSSTSHPSILRALYIDGQAFPRVDFLTNLLTFCVAVRNTGLTDHGLLTLLSASVAGSLYGGMGHSNVYEEPATYDLAARYLFETSSPASEPTTRADERGPPAVKAEAFEAQRWNPYALPWALRGLLEDPPIRDLFGAEIAKLLDDYAGWQPTTKTLKDVQWRLEPMRMISRPDVATGDGPSTPPSSTTRKTSALQPETNKSISKPPTAKGGNSKL